MSPVHLVGVPDASFTVVEGEETLKVVPGVGRMRHAFCSACGTGIYQHPEGMPFRAVFPPNFQIQDESGPGCGLPAHLLPAAHINYENRHFDANDSLPKYRVFKENSELLANDGTPIAEEK
jgi:hypothetical protein